MNKIDFLAFVDVLKSMKSDILYITTTGIYGFDNSLTIVKKLNRIYNVGRDIIIRTASLVEYSKSIVDIPQESDVSIPFMYLEPMSLANTLQNIIMSVHSLEAKNQVVYTCNLRESENFNSIMNMKTGDGVGILIVNDKYPITLYNNILPVNKADKVFLSISEIDHTSFLAQFIILKKKDITIHVYIRYLFLV